MDNVLISDSLQIESFYMACALAGSGLFVIQFILNLMGVTNHESAELSLGEDAQHFKWLSIQAMIGFLMFFGLVGMTCQVEFELSSTATLSIAIAAGLCAIFVTSFIFNLTKKLHSSGSVFKIEDAIGLEAHVYHRIPKGGVGKISMTLQQFTREIDAVSHAEEEIPSFTSVEIIDKKDDNTVVVKAI